MAASTLDENLLLGQRVRLSALRGEDTEIVAAWQRDGGYLRLLDAEPAYPRTPEQLRSWLEEAQKAKNGFVFGVRALEGDRLVGYLELDGILWAHQVAWLAIGIGERSDWGKGYGREALELGLGFAFRELNLHRVQLTVFAYNERAIALYEKLGFRREGVFREFMQRDGQRHDMYLYGILQAEWAARRAR